MNTREAAGTTRRTAGHAPRRATSTNLVALAWRNVFRNRRRSALNIVALTVGMSILVLALGWIGGYHRYIYDTLNDFQTGELQIVHEEWYAERTRLPVDTLIGDHEELRSAALSLPAVRSAAPRVAFSARVSTGSQSFRIMATAIDPATESTVGVLDEYIVEGAPPAALAAGPGRGVWIGSPVAEKAEIAVGDTLFLRAMNRHGVENLYDAPVVGIFEYGYPVLDKQMIYLDLATADELLDLDGGVTHLVMRLHDGERVGDAAEAVGRAVATQDWTIAAAADGSGGAGTSAAESGAAESGGAESDATGSGGAEGRTAIARIEGSRGGVTPVGSPLQIRPWQDFARTAVSAVEGDTYSFSVMISVMYLLIVLGILNSMSMSVHERTREIGTIRAIGIRRRQLLTMFALESIWQAIIAAAIALVITTPVAIWLARTGIDIASSMPETMPVPFGERFRADFAVWHYIFTLASGVLTALAGAIIPARRAGTITVAEAMRTVG